MIQSSSTWGIDYLSEIKPLLAEKCYSCHGALKQESDLRLDTLELMKRGGSSGSVIDLDDPSMSQILQRVLSSEDDRMPPEGEGSALNSDQIATLLQWIEQGAVAPKEKIPVGPRDHWAFQPIKPSQTVSSEEQDNLIDVLLAKKYAELGIEPQPPAPKTIQIRRLYLDLIGLPPNAQQLLDHRTIPEIVDELLSNPHHGERWARHWMDIWRYSDWYGLGQQLRNSQKHIWHWRDWIIHSLNEDKGYNRMIQEMLAGDEISPTDPSVLAATGFLARNYYLFNRTTWLDNTIEHTSKAFLGLTMNCAKCHDHKYDPITHVDYYRMRAIFEPHQVRLDPVPGTTDFESDGLPRVFDDHLDAVTHLHQKGDPKNPDLSHVIEAGIPEIFSEQQEEIRTVSLPPFAFAPGTRGHVLADQLANLDQQIADAEKELAAVRIEREQQKLQESKQPATSQDDLQDFKLVETFDELNEERWDLVGDNWEISDGMLHQKVATRDTHYARLKQEIPKNFEANCYYTHTGGTTYRSVTFRFDESDDQKNSNFVYTSAHAPGPKIQVASTRNGQSDYPANGRKSHKIEEGKRYHLRFALKDDLINVWLDGSLVIAYQYPERLSGNFSLSGFDSTVSFDELTLESLPKETELKTPENYKPGGWSAEKKLRIAEAKLEKLNRERISIEATIHADTATQSANSKKDLGRQASSQAVAMDPRIISDARLLAAQRQQELKIAEIKLQGAESSRDVSEAIRKEEAKLSALQKSQPQDISYTSFKASRKALETPADKEINYPAIYPSTSTGRRSALANWIASEKNPLTARVAVNHVWLRHFGQPLVESVFDFGLRATPPKHQDILDALSLELMESGWSFKHLHRIIVTSKAYQRTSSSLGADPQTHRLDPDNSLYWRMNPKRMESQLLRDSLLSLANQLDMTIGGASLDHNHQPPRRSIYLKHSPDVKDEFLETFDNANVLACYRRSESIVPQQALALVNSRISLSAAKALNQIMEEEHPGLSRKEFIELVFQNLLARPANVKEIETSSDFLSALMHPQATDANPKAMAETEARERLLHVILNHHEFITIR